MSGIAYLTAVLIAAYLGARSARWWRYTVPTVIVLSFSPLVVTSVSGYLDFRREREHFRTQPLFLHDGDEVIEGIHSPDGSRVTFTLRDGRQKTIGPPAGTWYDQYRAGVNLRADVYRGGAVTVVAFIVYGVARLVRRGSSGRSEPITPAADTAERRAS